MDKLVLEDGLDLEQLVTKGSFLRINEDYLEEPKPEASELKPIDFIGKPIMSFEEFEKNLITVDNLGYVKKKIIEEGGGVDLHDGCTVSIAYSGYWEGEQQPFDIRTEQKPIVVDLKDNGLLPGLEMAVRSMLVGELSVFLLNYRVMFGEHGILSRIKPKANSAFYIKLVRSILTPKSTINFSEPNMFGKVYREAQLLYSSGYTMFKNNNYIAAIQLFRKAVTMLEKCRLADEAEEKKQEALLIKLYTNLAISYNWSKQPLRACTACNEVNRLQSIWKNNAKVLFQNAKALRMIGDFKRAEKKLLRAMELYPNTQEMEHELEILRKTQNACSQSTLVIGGSTDILSNEFKESVDALIRNFKLNDYLCKLTLPAGLSPAEIDYVKEVCNRENVFCTNNMKDLALDKKNEQNSVNSAEDEESL